MSKVGIIGVGNVGASYAYSLINQMIVDEIVLLDLSYELANAQAQDLIHGTNFLPRQTNIYAGTYEDIKDCDVICITSGVKQNQDETRLDLLKRNAVIIKSIITKIKEVNYQGILLIASNPVDIMTRVAQEVSGFDYHRVIGSGTVLDTARFRQNLAKYLGLNVTQIHANVIGEHGDASIPIWSTARVANKYILDLVNENLDKYSFEGLSKCFLDSQNAAYEIIEAKGSTSYGIGLSLSKITKAIIYNENIILNVSTYVRNHYRIKDLYISLPAIINKDGVSTIFESNITTEEYDQLAKTAILLKGLEDEIVATLHK